MPPTRHFLALCMVTLLAACASTPQRVSMSTDSSIRNQAHLQRNAKIQQFSLQGRIGVQTNSKGFSGGLQWQHTLANDNIALYSPLGGQVAQITKSSNQITLIDANGKQVSAANAETLTYNALGWSLPLTGLADWSLGRPSSSPIQASTWDEQGLLTTLEQDGWKIEFTNYTEQNGYWLPGKIFLKSDQVNLKLLVENWNNITN
ncbi:lipoprotein insertase outer membrane protein LolB [Methylotenera mobilis]|uniref:Outer-membrane lipoprotein LolB n=1 Tax=Methylotenera mobilis (strain JLW8 / ATCC BAA-1282 / DSM 17540) TaxID=583345 RepID=C6WXT3_METML|nr:lipoprotein insertase outer membrane protein LolB [Methylotenera mobilis]ACT48732.1 outer membrane lipoprotein LolB [Methylotenera mobilis JLW8]